MVLSRTGNIITKLFVASGNGTQVAVDDVVAVVAAAANRASGWSAEVDMSTVLQNLPGDLPTFRDQLLDAWARNTARLAAGTDVAGGTAAERCSFCGGAGATKRCSGCRAVAYCGRDCQKRHWCHGGHREGCSLEFSPICDALSACMRVKKARDAPGQPEHTLHIDPPSPSLAWRDR